MVRSKEYDTVKTKNESREPAQQAETRKQRSLILYHPSLFVGIISFNWLININFVGYKHFDGVTARHVGD